MPLVDGRDRASDVCRRSRSYQRTLAKGLQPVARAVEIEPVSDGAAAGRVSLGAGAAQHNRPLPSPNFRHRAEGKDSPPPREETATADDDLVRVVGVPLVADMIQPAEVCAVARAHPVAPGGGEEPAKFRVFLSLRSSPATLLRGRKISDGSGRLSSPAGAPRAFLVHARKNPSVGKDVPGPLSIGGLRASRASSTSAAHGRLRRRRRCAARLVGRLLVRNAAKHASLGRRSGVMKSAPSALPLG